MAPNTSPACESSEGINTMRRRLNSLHHPRGSLNSSIFFEERDVHSLRPAWTTRVPIAMESNMPFATWFNPNPYSIRGWHLGLQMVQSSKKLPTDEGWGMVVVGVWARANQEEEMDEQWHLWAYHAFQGCYHYQARALDHSSYLLEYRDQHIGL